MREGIREIATFMDAVEPPMQLRRLLAMHQLETGDGLAEIQRRHRHPEQIEIPFLFWNTFLMDFIRGITPDSRFARRLLGAVTLGVSEIARYHEKITEKFGKFWYEKISSVHDRPFKPAVEARSKEIGNLTSRFASIVALMEVWTNREKEWVLNSWETSPTGHVSEISERQLRSSGLLTISKDFPINKAGFHRYNAESGIDRLVGKGVLLSQIDIGYDIARLEIYSTHLNAASIWVKIAQFLELIRFIRRTSQATNPAILVGDFNLNAYATERFNFADLMAGIASDTSGGFWDEFNIGDGNDIDEFLTTFNRLPTSVTSFITGFNGTAYEFMTGCLGLLGFKDLWKHRNDLSSEENRGYGYTTDLLDGANADAVCPVDSDSDLKTCSELLSAPPNAKRIDYMFVSDTISIQPFTVDFTRPKRFRADRPMDAEGFDEMQFMSDHLGLISTLLVVPRS